MHSIIIVNHDEQPGFDFPSSEYHSNRSGSEETVEPGESNITLRIGFGYIENRTQRQNASSNEMSS